MKASLIFGVTFALVCLTSSAGVKARRGSGVGAGAGPRPSAPLSPLTSLMTGHELYPPPELPLPALHRPFKDPVYGTCIMRVTDPSQWQHETRIRHYYSKSNPFNADNTRAILWGSDGAYLLYDTKSWEPIRNLCIGSGDAEVS